MITTLVAALNGANLSLELVKRAVASHDQRVAEEAIDDMTVKLRDAHVAALQTAQDALKLAQDARALDKRIAELERENDTLKAKAQERERYTLVAIAPHSFAYALKDVEATVEPQHYCCQPCMDAGKKSVLQLAGGKGGLHCPTCNANVLCDDVARRQAEGWARLAAGLPRR
ncbi:hypothetical protein [Burkholderia ubonensis]|uniref:hypothetical protein n=1 Tax=Burkholderia ubonensis TaxID=101571 RepID=UPI0012FCB10D|nr:hypothetical protein [Burkholderia ubonensis]